MLSVPPATTTSTAPPRIAPTAVCTAARPPAQCRLTARPGTWWSPSETAVWRAMTPPPCIDSARTTSSMSDAGRPLRSITPATAVRASAHASTVASRPLRLRPMGVRAAATMAARRTGGSCPRNDVSAERLRRHLEAVVEQLPHLLGHVVALRSPRTADGRHEGVEHDRLQDVARDPPTPQPGADEARVGCVGENGFEELDERGESARGFFGMVREQLLRELCECRRGLASTAPLG